MNLEKNNLVSIIIPHHNNENILLNCLKSIYLSTYENFEIIVVDNASIDNSIISAKSLYPNINIAKSEYNLGYAGGCNFGAKEANGDFLFFLNNDTIINSDCLEALVNKLKSNKNIASVQPKILNLKNKNYFDYAGGSGGYIDYLVFPFTRGRIFDTIEKDKKQYDDSRKIFWASGAGFLTRKNIFNQLFKFDESFFAHMEEIDYHWKSCLAGYEVWAEPTATLYHLGGGTLQMQSAQKTYLNHRNSLILLLSNYSPIKSILYFILRFPLEIISSIKDLIIFKPLHFLNHYRALLWIIFNFSLIVKRRKKIKSIKVKSNARLIKEGLILNSSIVFKYYLAKKNKYSKL